MILFMTFLKGQDYGDGKWVTCSQGLTIWGEYSYKAQGSFLVDRTDLIVVMIIQISTCSKIHITGCQKNVYITIH